MSSRILWVSNFQSILWFLNTFCNKYIHGLHWAWGPARICCVRSPVCVETTNWIHVSIYSLTIEQIHISLLSLSSWKFGEPAILPSKRWGLIILTFLKESEWVGHFFSGYTFCWKLKLNQRVFEWEKEWDIWEEKSLRLICILSLS